MKVWVHITEIPYESDIVSSIHLSEEGAIKRCEEAMANDINRFAHDYFEMEVEP